MLPVEEPVRCSAARAGASFRYIPPIRRQRPQHLAEAAVVIVLARKTQELQPWDIRASSALAALDGCVGLKPLSCYTTRTGVRTLHVDN